MREIEFRAWDKNKKKMIYSGLEYYSRLLDIHNSEEGQDIIGFTDWEQKHFNFMQYTGLNDKNDNKIFEGDIFHANNYPFYNDGLLNYVGEIYIDNRPECMAWYYEIHVVSNRVSGRACGGSLAQLVGIEITVIGNIYENPELLES